MTKNVGESGKVIPFKIMLFRLESMGGESVSVRSFAMQFTDQGNIQWATDMVRRLISAGYAHEITVADPGSEGRVGWVILTKAGRRRLDALRTAEHRKVTGYPAEARHAILGALSGRKGASDG